MWAEAGDTAVHLGDSSLALQSDLPPKRIVPRLRDPTVPVRRARWRRRHREQTGGLSREGDIGDAHCRARKHTHYHV